MQQPLWGIDLGGTKIEGAILPSLSHHEPIVRTRLSTEGHLGYEHIINRIVQLVDEMKALSGLTPTALGIGTPGTLEPGTELIKNSNTTALIGQPLKRDLEQRLKIPVAIANDANCFALAETHWGVVKQNFAKARLVFGVIMGTGVGGGIVIDGKVWNGHHGIAGEWGHNFLDDSGGQCYCGKTGCVETVLSGPALERYYKGLTGRQVSLQQIVASNALNNDPFANDTMNRLGHFFGKAISTVTNLLDPDVIIIGGGLGNIDLLYTEGVDSLGKFIFNPAVNVPIVKPLLGDSAGVFGAAALVA